MVGEPDGFGHYGVLEETEDGLLCASCGWVGAHLGLHAFKAHGVTANDYRPRFGLLRSRGPVAAETRARIRANARDGLAARPTFVAKRDPAAATQERLRARRPATAEEVASRDARMSLIGRRGRIDTVITCEWCGVEFCPLGSKRRRFCSRSCSARHNRRVGRNSTSTRLTPAHVEDLVGE
jgi:hypothetical protein